MRALPLFFLVALNPLLTAQESARVYLPDEKTIIDTKTFEQRQRLAKTNSAWHAFTSAHPEWQTWWNRHTGSPHRAWGDGIQVRGYFAIHSGNAPDAGWRFVNDFRDVLGIDPQHLVMIQSEEALGKWYFKFQQQYKGIRVLNSYVDLRMSARGKVFLFGSDFVPNISIDSIPSIPKLAAMEFSKAGLDYLVGTAHISGGELFILPMKFEHEIQSRLVYNFLIEQSTEELWDTYVDAHSGEVLWRFNVIHTNHGQEENVQPMQDANEEHVISQVSHLQMTDHTTTSMNKPSAIFQGRITADIFPISYTRGSAIRPLFDVYVNINGKEVATDKNGEFQIDEPSKGNDTLRTRLAGKWSIARRADTVNAGVKNASMMFVVTAGNPVQIHWSDSNSHAAERNVFYHVSEVHNFIRSIDPSSDLDSLDFQMRSNMNVSGTCNAFWNVGSRSVNFFPENDRCGNTALIADVVYHEYGHGINSIYYLKLRGRGMTNGALS